MNHPDHPVNEPYARHWQDTVSAIMTLTRSSRADAESAIVDQLRAGQLLVSPAEFWTLTPPHVPISATPNENASESL